MYLQVDDIHKLNVYAKGNKNGVPVIFLHGGPGGNVDEKCEMFFDFKKHFVIFFDQRGCGKSIPFAEIKNNNIDNLVEDIEKIRKYYKIDDVVLFGGSFGSTLALCYAIKYPENVRAMVLRGIFLGRDEDVKWLYQEGASYFYPENYKIYRDFIEVEKQDDLVSAYYEKLTSEDIETRNRAAKIWSNWEMGLVNFNTPEKENCEITDKDISLALLECYYFVNHMFFLKNTYIFDNISRIKDMTIYIVHGRYDIDCRVKSAYELHEKLNNSVLHIVQSGGHSPYEKDMFKTLKTIMNGF